MIYQKVYLIQNTPTAHINEMVNSLEKDGLQTKVFYATSNGEDHHSRNNYYSKKINFEFIKGRLKTRYYSSSPQAAARYFKNLYLESPSNENKYAYISALKGNGEAEEAIKLINEMLEKMMSSDYENLVKVFDDEFGSVVTLLR